MFNFQRKGLIHLVFARMISRQITLVFMFLSINLLQLTWLHSPTPALSTPKICILKSIHFIFWFELNPIISLDYTHKNSFAQRKHVLQNVFAGKLKQFPSAKLLRFLWKWNLNADWRNELWVQTVWKHHFCCVWLVDFLFLEFKHSWLIHLFSAVIVFHSRLFFLSFLAHTHTHFENLHF